MAGATLFARDVLDSMNLVPTLNELLLLIHEPLLHHLAVVVQLLVLFDHILNHGVPGSHFRVHSGQPLLVLRLLEGQVTHGVFYLLDLLLQVLVDRLEVEVVGLQLEIGILRLLQLVLQLNHPLVVISLGLLQLGHLVLQVLYLLVQFGERLLTRAHDVVDAGGEARRDV